MNMHTYCRKMPIFAKTAITLDEVYYRAGF